MEGRCFVCHCYHLDPDALGMCFGALLCCRGCRGALELVCRFLGQAGGQPVSAKPTGELAEGSLRLRGALRRFVEVTDPSNGIDSGHALERVDRDDGTVTYACVMPACRLCAAIGFARTVLSDTEGLDESIL